MKERNTYLSSASVKKQGRTAYYKMLESAKQGELIQVRRGVYANIDQLSGNMIDINAVVPEGILCLWSAWSIHQLTTSMPQAFHVAIKRGRKVSVPSFPQIEVHHYTEELLNIGVISMVIDSFIIRLYDFIKHCPVECRMPRTADTLDQLFNIRPAMFIQADSDDLRSVPQNLGNKFADICFFFFVLDIILISIISYFVAYFTFFYIM